MHSKLTLRLKSEVIERAKRYAQLHDRSLSQMVEGYFERLSSQSSSKTTYGPITDQLLGVVKATGMKNERDEYRQYIVKKYTR